MKMNFDKRFIWGGALFVLTVVGIFIGLRKPSGLQVCFSGRNISWNVQNRAAEAAKVGIWGWRDTEEQKASLSSAMGCGSLGYTVVTDYQKALSAPMTSSQSFVPVTSLTLKDGTILDASTLGNVIFLTLEPGATNEEIVDCTGIDATNKQFTGCTRGLAFSGTSTAAVSANQKTHSSGATVVMSNVHYVYQQFLDKNGSTQYVTSTVVFNSPPSVSSTTFIPTSNNQLTSWYAAQTLVAGGFSSLNVSSTLGLEALSGVSNCSTSGTCVGINASSTGGIKFYPGTGSVYVNASSSASDTLGGYLKHTFDTWNVLYWDAVSWLSSNHTYSGTNVFNGNVTGTANFDVTTAPTLSSDVVNYNAMVQFIATGTAMTTLSTGQPLYMSTTSTLGLASSATATTAYPFVGFSLGSYTVGQTAQFLRVGGILTTSGLSAGSYYYIQDTAGTIGTSKGTFPVKVGLALSSTRLLIQKPSFNTSASGVVSLTTIGTPVSTVTGWIPKRIDVICGGNSGGGTDASSGWWQANSDGSSFQRSIGEDTSADGFYTTTTPYACAWKEGTTEYAVTVATTTSGFTATCISGFSGSCSPRYMSYTASYYDE